METFFYREDIIDWACPAFRWFGFLFGGVGMGGGYRKTIGFPENAMLFSQFLAPGN